MMETERNVNTEKMILYIEIVRYVPCRSRECLIFEDRVFLLSMKRFYLAECQNRSFREKIFSFEIGFGRSSVSCYIKTWKSNINVFFFC